MERLAEGYGILANITALIIDIPLGHRRVEIGLQLRQEWLINGLLCNSKVWQKLTEKDKKDLDKIDHIVLRTIVGAQSKAPIEQLYLETASVPLTEIMRTRRLIYLQTILKRPDSELTRKVFDAMRTDPIPDDWCLLVDNDFKEINLKIGDQEIINMDPINYKALIKSRVRDNTYIKLKEIQASHEKGSLMVHKDLLNPQDYLKTNKLNNKQIGLLFNLRCQSLNGIRDNFHKLYHGDITCRLCLSEIDSQSHLLQCSELKKHIQINHDIKYEHIYGTLPEQITVTLHIAAILEVRERLLEGGAGLPGHPKTGPLDIS